MYPTDIVPELNQNDYFNNVNLQGIIFCIHPAHRTRLLPQERPVPMQQSNQRHRDEESNDPLRGKRPCEAVCCLPWRDKELENQLKNEVILSTIKGFLWLNKTTLEKPGIEGDMKNESKLTHRIHKST